MKDAKFESCISFEGCFEGCFERYSQDSEKTQECWLDEITARIEFYNARGSLVEMVKTAGDWYAEIYNGKFTTGHCVTDTITDEDLLLERVELFNEAGVTYEFTSGEGCWITFKDFSYAIAELAGEA